MPLEADLLEMAELYQAWGAWLVGELLPAALLLLALMGVALALNMLLASGASAAVGGALAFICLGHLCMVVLLA
jgi:hypothetical protein